MTKAVSASEEAGIKVLACLEGGKDERGQPRNERFLCVSGRRQLLLLERPPAGDFHYVGPPCSLAEAEQMATAVLAGDNWIATHPQTLHAVCLAVVAAKVQREAAAERVAAAVPAPAVEVAA